MNYLIPEEKRAKKCKDDCNFCTSMELLAPKEICYPNQVPDYGEGAVAKMTAIKESGEYTHSL